MSKSNVDPLRSLTRLMVGSAMLGLDGLMNQLQVWENETTRELEDQQSAEGKTIIDVPCSSAPSIDLNSDTVRYALIGLLFEAQNRIEDGMKELNHSARQVETMLAPAFELLEKNEALAPLREEFDHLVKRGEAEVSRLVTMGQAEEHHSRKLIYNAMSISADTTISQVVENPKVEKLVHTQSVGLANEIVEEVRERGVSIDTYLERWSRLLLRRKPRDAMNEPVVQVELPKAHTKAYEAEG